MQKSLNVFISYAHKDEPLLRELEEHLAVLQKQEVITTWHDRNISAGTEWKQEIDTRLNAAHIILLLISASFLASDYCYGFEMKRALERHEGEQARVIPIILRPVDWEEEPSLMKLQALPTDGKPVTDWSGESGRDHAFRNVARGIRKASRELCAIQLYHEGVALYNAEHYEGALTGFRQAIQLDPDNAQFYKSTGEVLSKLGRSRYEESLKAFEQTSKHEPQDAVAYKYQGWLLNELERYEEALRACQQAIQLDPQNADAYHNKGWALYELKRYNEALDAYEQALRLGYHPTDPHYDIVRGLNNLGVIKSSLLQHDSTPDGKGLYWHYSQTSVHWSPETGIHAVDGPIRDKWAKLDWECGILGYPTTDVMGLPDGVGRHCHFQHGCIYWSPDTEACEVHGPIRDKWASLRWEQSFLGYPIADQKNAPDGVGRISNFQHGSIYWTPDTEAHEIHGEIRKKWAGLRWELGYLGYPIGDEEPTADGVGHYQHFQTGSIFWFPKTGAHAVHGPIRDKWASLGEEQGILGYPTTDVEGLPDQIGQHCHFQYGCIYWLPEVGAHEVHGPIRDKWASLGWEQSFLGYPVANQKASPDGVGCISVFQKGAIYYTPETGAHELHSPIFEKWASLHWERGILRYPTSDQESTEDGIGCYQHFQKGSIFWSPETGAQEVYGAIWERWKKIGWERGILGYPTTGEMGAADGVGRYSHFQHGSIYYYGDADISAHEVHGAIREKWGGLGWERSFLGYPLTDEMTAPDSIGRISYFQHGAIYWWNVAEPVVLKGPGKALLERLTSAEAFVLALQQAIKPLPTVLSVVIYHIDHRPEKNCGFYRIGRNLDANGIAADGWSKPVPRSVKAREHQGAGIGLADFDGSGHPDLLIFRIDRSEQKDRAYYRIGRNLNANGTAAGGWPDTIRVPDPFGKHNLGAGIAIADLNRSGRPDLLIFYLECRTKENRGFYRVGRDFDSDKLEPVSWSEPLQIPGSFSSEQYCTGIAQADLDGNGRPDLIVFYIEHQEEENHGYYRIGKHLDSDGLVTDGWSEPILVPGSFGRQNHGASIAITDLSRNGRPDLAVFYIEHPEDGDENSGYYRIGKNLDASGYATGGWSEPIQVPGRFGKMNQGAGIAFTTLV